MPKIILTSSFGSVAKELYGKDILPKAPQRVAFILTASQPYADKPWMQADRKALVDLGYVVTDIDLKEKSGEELTELLKASDVIFVAGGNTTYLFEHSHTSGFDAIIRDLLAAGRIYIGSSAGSILAGPTVEPFVDDDLLELPKDFVLHDRKGLGLVDYVVLPHQQEFTERNDKLAEKFSDKLKSVKLADTEYRVIA